MMQKILAFVLISLCTTNLIVAQTNTILPYTGARIFAQGVLVKNIDITVDGYNLTNNVVPVNKEIMYRFQLPSGFKMDASKNAFAAAEVILQDANGKELSKSPNVLSTNAAGGFSPANFKELKITVGLRPDVLKSNPSCFVSIRLYDLKGTNQLKLYMPVVFNKPGTGFQAAQGITLAKIDGAAQAYINNVKLSTIYNTVDTSIRVNKTMAYQSFEMMQIQGVAMDEVLAGTESFWVYDEATLTEIKIADKLLKSVGGSAEGIVSKYVVKIPFRTKADRKKYVIRFRWENKDKKRVIDIVANS